MSFARRRVLAASAPAAEVTRVRLNPLSLPRTGAQVSGGPGRSLRSLRQTRRLCFPTVGKVEVGDLWCEGARAWPANIFRSVRRRCHRAAHRRAAPKLPSPPPPPPPPKTIVVADTGDLAALERLRPRDATTNPALILKAARGPNGNELLEAAMTAADEEDVAAAAAAAQGHPNAHANVSRWSRRQRVCDHLTASLAAQAANFVDPATGRVSVEVDAALADDEDATVARALRLAHLLASRVGGNEEVPRRFLLKVAATRAGVGAVARLEAGGATDEAASAGFHGGLRCNATLIFSLGQVSACAAAGAFLVSPFVGRLLDYHRLELGYPGPPAQKTPQESAAVRDARYLDDPGVRLVRRACAHLARHGAATEVMAASFRSLDQVRGVCGAADRVTVAPALLDELEALKESPLLPGLGPRRAAGPLPDDEAVVEVLDTTNEPPPDAGATEAQWQAHEAEPGAAELLRRGVELFRADGLALEALVGG